MLSGGYSLSDHTRRQFLRLLSGIAAGGLSGVFTASKCLASDASGAGRQNPAYNVLPFKGDDFTLGHLLRDGRAPQFPDKAEERHDFVIVGGGMAGLACANYLKGEDFLLLEQYAQTGGTSSGGSYRGIDYSMGAVCTGSHDGIFGQLFQELDLTPALIPPEQIAWHCNGKWWEGRDGKDSFYKELNRLTAELSQLSKQMEGSAAGKRDEIAGKLKTSTFDKMLSGYDPGFVALISNICKSFFCAGPDYVTALAGTFMIKALTTNSYVFEGGNSGLARALRKNIDKSSPGRVHSSSFVWLVEPKTEGASVVYSDKEGNLKRVDCKHAVVCTPPLVTLKLVPQLPPQIRIRLEKLEYAAFLVANFCMKKKVMKNPYQSFADEPLPFCQLVMAEAPYEAMSKYKPEMGSVLTVYHPYQHGPAGRAQMMMDQKERLAESMLSQLEKLLEPLEGNLEQVVLTRWGHALIVPKVGISDLLAETQGKDPDWMTLAHSSSKGGPSMEGAILAARYAADRCLAKKSG